MQAAPYSTTDYQFHTERLKFTLALAVLIHAVVLLGVGFLVPKRAQLSTQLEVTLAQYKIQQAAEDAEYLAQWNQQGSGDLAEKSILTAPEVSAIKSNQINQLQKNGPRVERSPDTQTPVLHTVSQAVQRIQLEQPNPLTPPQPNNHPDDDLEIQSSSAIASLEARLDQQRNAYAAMPRVHRVTSMSTRYAIGAQYVHHWRQRVEAVGNRFYPAESRRKGIYGSLRLLVAIRADGSIKNIEILSSSGHQLLDSAAIRIVKMAAPYAPFSKQLRQTTDELEVIRTWQFQQNRLSSS